MSKFIDFPILYGKMGNHPGNLSTNQAMALFKTAMSCPQGSNFIEYWPDFGRSTIILGTVAKNLDGHLNVYTNWTELPPLAKLWFDRGIKTHQLMGIISLDNGAPLTGELTVIRAAMGAPLTNTGKVFVLGRDATIGPDWTLLDDGGDYSVWEKVK